jgi:hypothetical protein
LAVLAASLIFLPFGFGNGYLTRLAQPLRAGSTDPAVLVQVSFVPRLRQGLRAWFEDADDIGWLSVVDSRLVFQGDSVQLSLPLTSLTEVQLENIGWRGLFAYGPKVRVVAPGLGLRQVLYFGERSSLLLPQSRRIARAIFRMIAREPGPPAQSG